jgi:hypothetical protein
MNLNNQIFILLRNKLICSLFAIALFSNMSYAQVKVSGITVPAKLGFGGTVRELNGAGTRVKYMMHIYVGALYLKEKSKDPKVIVNADKPMSVRLQIISAMLTNENMVRYIREGFYRSLDGKVAPFKEHLDLICEVFSSEPTKVGDVYDIHYTPGIGVSASKNGKPFQFTKMRSTGQVKSGDMKLLKQITHTKDGYEAIPGLDFKKALFGIWLSDDPVDEDLKDAMLGL